MKQETINEVLKFRDERNWKQFHNPKDLAISISLEAAELLEIFQWSADDVWCKDKMEKIREELADVLNYCILMADTCGLDMDKIIQEKVRKNGEKYPFAIYRYNPGGELTAVSFQVSPHEEYIYNKDGSLNCHWVGNTAYDKDGKVIGKAEEIKQQED